MLTLFERKHRKPNALISLGFNPSRLGWERLGPERFNPVFWRLNRSPLSVRWKGSRERLLGWEDYSDGSLPALERVRWPVTNTAWPWATAHRARPGHFTSFDPSAMAVTSFPSSQQGIHPAGELMLADGVEGASGSWWRRSYRPVAAGFGIGLAILPQWAMADGAQATDHLVPVGSWRRRSAQIDQQATGAAQEGGHAQVARPLAFDHCHHHLTRPRSNGSPGRPRRIFLA